MLKGISDKKGISDGKLNHIFLGTVKNKVSGFHCDLDLGDELVCAEARLYPKSKHRITANREQKIFEAYVREKSQGTLKEDNGGKSTFFNSDWSRQEVVDCIERLESMGKLLKEYGQVKKKDRHKVFLDKKTGMIVVDNLATSFPLLKY